MTTSRHHAVNRTSPKGTAFIGTCSQCGQAGLTLAQTMTTECPNQRGLTEAEAVLEVIEEARATPSPATSEST